MRYVYYKDTQGEVSIRIPKENYIGCIQCNALRREIQWPVEYLRALKNPYGAARLKDIAQGKRRVVILVGDYTRAVPAKMLLPPLMDELHQAGISESQITIVIACGLHRPSTRKEMAQIVGDNWVRRLKVVNHNALDSDRLTFLGKTRKGTPVWINSLVSESDLCIALGQIEPHEYAGFTGGRKSILPGVCGEETIRFNHSPEMIEHPLAKPGMLEGNPVHEDMVECALMAGIDFIVNVVINRDLKIIGVFAGDMLEAHSQGVDFVNSFSRVEIPTQPDIIITTPGKPLDVDFYQSLKALIAVDAIASPETIVVFYSSCPDGLGSMGREMLKAFRGVATPEEVEMRVRSHHRVQMDHAFLLSKIMQKGIKIIAYSPNVPSNIIKEMMIPADSVQEGLDMALQLSKKKIPRVLVYPEAQRTLPFLEKDASNAL
jgi:nickel-dependent lactate racemase